MSRHMDALHAARDLTDSLCAEWNVRMGHGATGYRGKLSYLSEQEALAALRKEQGKIHDWRRALKDLDTSIESEFVRICADLGIPYKPGESSGS